MRSIRIRNATSSPIYVRPHLRGGWQAADFVFGFAELALGVNDLKGLLIAAGLADLPSTISTFEDVHKVIHGLGKIDDGFFGLKELRTDETGLQRITDKQKYIVERFKQTAFPIAAEKTRDVFDTGLLDEVTTPAGIASLLGADTVVVTIVTEDGNQWIVFDSSDAAHWVVSPTVVFNEKDRERHFHHWNRLLRQHPKT